MFLDMLAPNDANERLRSRQSLKFGIDSEISNPRGLMTLGVTR